MTTLGSPVLAEARHSGRPRDAARDEAIREAARELLAEVGYDLLTMDAVAARAHASKATIYRRWPSKAELVIDTVGCLVAMPELPDRGSVEEDLRTALGAKGLVDDFRLRLMSGLVSALPRNPDLARVFQDKFVAGRARALRKVLERGVSRGEVPADRDLDLLTAIFPAMLIHRALILGRPVDVAYLRAVVEQVLLPLATAPSATARSATARASSRPTRSLPKEHSPCQ